MIGLPSLFLRTAMVLVFATLGWMIGRQLWRSGRRGRAALGLVPMGAAAAMAAQLAFNLVYLRELRGMAPGTVIAVAVGGMEIRDAAALKEVAVCLAAATWFDGRHGQGAPFEISRHDGSRRVWRIVRHGEGAVLDFGLTSGRARLYRGAAFSECLPEVLRRQGASLPDNARLLEPPPNQALERTGAIASLPPGTAGGPTLPPALP